MAGEAIAQPALDCMASVSAAPMELLACSVSCKFSFIPAGKKQVSHAEDTTYLQKL